MSLLEDLKLMLGFKHLPFSVPKFCDILRSRKIEAACWIPKALIMEIELMSQFDWELNLG